MEKKYLIVNTGSTSKKYGFYEGTKKVYSAHFEMEKGSVSITESINSESHKKSITQKEYPMAVGVVISSLIENKIINSKKEIDFVGIRIVAPGEYFLTDRLIDSKYMKLANVALEKVPLHLGPALEEIKNIKKIAGEKINIYGVSDSSFHSTIPEATRLYGISLKDSRRFGLYMYGYHGISVQSVVSRAKAMLGNKLPEKVIVCHLGGGASVTAVKNGKSINTSMGFTPLEGLIMATRVGDIDAGAVLYLADKLKKNTKELGHYFNNKCGLLGLSRKSSDIRELLVHEKNGDADSTTALKIYTDRVKQYIGKMSADLGGVDLLILAGTVGERSVIMRERICDGLKFLGIEIDKKLNGKTEGAEAEITKAGSPARVLIIKTDEMEEIAKSAYSLAKNK